MVVPKGQVLVLAACLAVCGGSGARAVNIAGPTSPQASGTNSGSNSAQSSSGTSSSKPHSKASHHTTVEEEEGPSPDLTKAEEFIQKQDFTQAEPLLRKVVETDPAKLAGIASAGANPTRPDHMAVPKQLLSVKAATASAESDASV